MLGTPVDLAAAGVGNYAVAGVADHLCPWQNCYQSAQLLGGGRRFVLSTSGHIAAIVNPPGNPKASYRVGEEKLADAGQWMQVSCTERGNWRGGLPRLAHRARRSAEAEPGRTRHDRAGSAGRRARHLCLRELRFH
jgi:poly(3-hydroxyalkanoate) synthetase